jgi:hypothetical protein
MFWTVMGVALLLMLIEDAGDVRHEIRRIVERWTGLPRHTGMLDRVVEFSYFTLLASVPLYALLRYGKHLRSQAESLSYVLAGFGFYALAGISSATRNWGAWYANAGVRTRPSITGQALSELQKTGFGYTLHAH